MPATNDRVVGEMADFRPTMVFSKPLSTVQEVAALSPTGLVRGAEMRIAETRALNRALRKAYGIGFCSVEEIGTIPNTGEKLPPQNANERADRDRNVRVNAYGTSFREFWLQMSPTFVVQISTIGVWL